LEIIEFINHCASVLDETDAGTLFPETKFREIEEWSSLTALSVIAMGDDVYHIRIRGEDISQAVTIQDIYNIVKSRIQ
jgi:acyl carrier protein